MENVYLAYTTCWKRVVSSPPSHPQEAKNQRKPQTELAGSPGIPRDTLPFSPPHPEGRKAWRGGRGEREINQEVRSSLRVAFRRLQETKKPKKAANRTGRIPRDPKGYPFPSPLPSPRGGRHEEGGRGERERNQEVRSSLHVAFASLRHHGRSFLKLGGGFDSGRFFLTSGRFFFTSGRFFFDLWEVNFNPWGAYPWEVFFDFWEVFFGPLGGFF